MSFGECLKMHYDDTCIKYQIKDANWLMVVPKLKYVEKDGCGTASACSNCNTMLPHPCKSPTIPASTPCPWFPQSILPEKRKSLARSCLLHLRTRLMCDCCKPPIANLQLLIKKPNLPPSHAPPAPGSPSQPMASRGSS